MINKQTIIDYVGILNDISQQQHDWYNKLTPLFIYREEDALIEHSRGDIEYVIQSEVSYTYGNKQFTIIRKNFSCNLNDINELIPEYYKSFYTELIKVSLLYKDVDPMKNIFGVVINPYSLRTILTTDYNNLIFE